MIGCNMRLDGTSLHKGKTVREQMKIGAYESAFKIVLNSMFPQFSEIEDGDFYITIKAGTRAEMEKEGIIKTEA